MTKTKVIDEFTKPTGTIIGKGFTIQAAKFTGDESESMRVDGTVVGDIEVDGVLNISESGFVDGNISAGFVRIAGRVAGNVHCRNALHLASTADVIGDVTTALFIVDEGALLHGRCQTLVAVDALPLSS